MGYISPTRGITIKAALFGAGYGIWGNIMSENRLFPILEFYSKTIPYNRVFLCDEAHRISKSLRYVLFVVGLTAVPKRRTGVNEEIWVVWQGTPVRVVAIWLQG